MIAFALALALAATPPRYGGEVRVLAPASAVDAERLDPSDARSPLELALTRTLCEPLYRLGPNGTLASGLAQLSDTDPRARSLTLRLRSGLQTAGGLPLRARDVASDLARLSQPGNPYRALLLPLSNGGLSARSDTELAAVFEFPYPDWLLGLSHVGACPLPAGKRASAQGAQTGPFALESGRIAAPGARLAGNLSCPAGRPYADRLALRASTPKSAARALAAGDADVALLPVPEPAERVDGPLSVATYLVANPARPRLAALAASELDRGELVRVFVRGAQPLYGLLAPSVEPHPVTKPVAMAAPAQGPARAELLVESSDEQRAVASRLQVIAHDHGLELKVTALSREELTKRLGSGDFDAALVTIPALPEPGLNLAQVLLLVQPPEAVRAELAAIGAQPDVSARREKASARARELQARIPVVPLYAQGLSAAVRPHLRGLAFDASGAPDLGNLWLDDDGAHPAGPKAR